MPDWDTISYVIRSEYRKRVLLELHGNKITPSNIAEKLDMYPSHVSNSLSELRDKSLVESLVDSPKGRIYTLTEEGEEVAETIQEENL